MSFNFTIWYELVIFGLVYVVGWNCREICWLFFNIIELERVVILLGIGYGVKLIVEK